MRLMKKKIKGHTYWYLVESARVNGRLRITWQLHLGKSEDIAARWQGGRPVVVAEFGPLAARRGALGCGDPRPDRAQTPPRRLHRVLSGPRGAEAGGGLAEQSPDPPLI